jgi:hyperosmotically inducible periplasmic protein
MVRKFKKGIWGTVAMVVLIAFAGVTTASTKGGMDPMGDKASSLTLEDRVQHELVMLPYLGVFDNVSFTIKDSNTVELTGYVVRAMLKVEVESAVRQVQGVAKVVDNVEVLPLSTFDAALRERAYRAIFSRSGFEKYAIQVNPPIRIIVKNGAITLEGMVGNQLDKKLADQAARSVSGAFSVTDNLVIG